MRRILVAIACALAALAAPLALSACGEEEHSEAVEGEPLELGELGYNVQLTRFLNPDDVEDSEYLVGQPDAPPGALYLGVFIAIENDSEEAHESADTYVVHDTLDNQYEPIPSESPYALEIGAEVEGEGRLPLPDSTAASGPNQAALLIFTLQEESTENRPLKLEIESDEGSGEVLLDI
jgi:hypothetical protein